MPAIFSRRPSGPQESRLTTPGVHRSSLILCVLVLGACAGSGVPAASGASPITGTIQPSLKSTPPTMVWTGGWSSSASYTPGNVTSYQGASYVAVTGSQGVAPTGAPTSQKAWTILVGPVPAAPVLYTTGAYTGPSSLGIVHLAHFVRTRLLTLSLPAGNYEATATLGIGNLDSDTQQFSCELDVNSDNSLTGLVDNDVERLGGLTQTIRDLHAVVQLPKPGYVILQCNTYDGNLLAPTLTARQVGSVIRQ